MSGRNAWTRANGPTRFVATARREREQTRVVDEDVGRPAERRRHLGGGSVDGRGVRDVTDDGERARAERCCGGAQRGRAAREHRDAGGAGAGEGARAGEADAARRAGDEGGASGEGRLTPRAHRPSYST
jgi:hypothetical protein